MTGVGDYDESSNAFVRAYQRLPWLLISVLLNLVIAVLLSVFEKTLIEVVALIMFQPMILGMAGNIGTQSIAVTILKLNQDELEEKNAEKKHILKEIGIGFLNSCRWHRRILAILRHFKIDQYRKSQSVIAGFNNRYLVNGMFVSLGRCFHSDHFRN